MYQVCCVLHVLGIRSQGIMRPYADTVYIGTASIYDILSEGKSKITILIVIMYCIFVHRMYCMYVCIACMYATRYVCCMCVLFANTITL